MADPFMGEIRIVGFNFAPSGWALCNGQQLPISQNQALFALLGDNYGGNGQTTFALPDFRERYPVGVGNGFDQADTGGEASHTLSLSELPTHTHAVNAATDQTNVPSAVPTSNVLGKTAASIYTNTPGSPLVTMNAASVAAVGGSQSHTNMMPYLVLNFCIALVGVFPSQN
jgi:microcystin-dependent protein